ncbi:mitochondrial carrier [Calocera cornea HHB12733]|uniref:Mitochondrial carrier n=1 Tax=Calocera cornea HHB12733 TaxID=1353952 RepID=A0A165IK74_9BASI|nr:mitochondrial carrier [Calocera cornea HHB12733]
MREPSLPGAPPPAPRRWFIPPDSMLAGGGAGFVSSIIMCPLDVIKTKLQAQTVRHGHMDYLGAVGTVKQVLGRNGLRGLYRGLGPTLLGYLPTWAIYFTVYDGFKRTFGVGDRLQEQKRYIISNSWALHIAAAMTAGATGTIITNPLWVIKTRFMTQPHSEPPYRSTLDAIRVIYRTEGLAAFYSGLAPSLFGVIHVAVQFPLYERLKAWQIEKTAEPLSYSQLLMCSAVSKAVASVATYPHEVVRTRMQVQRRAPKNGNGAATSAAPTSAPSAYRGIVQTFLKIVADEGWRGLYKGLLVNLMRTVPNSIVTLVRCVLFPRLLCLWLVDCVRGG